MKRESIAETTLRKQLRALNKTEAEIEAEIETLKAKRDTVIAIRMNIEQELGRLYQVRQISSEKNKQHHKDDLNKETGP